MYIEPTFTSNFGTLLSIFHAQDATYNNVSLQHTPTHNLSFRTQFCASTSTSKSLTSFLFVRSKENQYVPLVYNVYAYASKLCSS